MEVTVFHRSETGAKFHAFLDQQEIVHNLGLALTLFVTADSLFDLASIPIIRRFRDHDGDELGLSLHSLPGFPTDFIWLLSPEQKREAIRTLAGSFREQFGSFPQTVAAYHMDATTMTILAEELPSVTAVVAGCFEEGVRVFHGCNHSWYLFNEGMPWWPWWPSRDHALSPTSVSERRFPFLAVPHLVRDMVLSYEGRNDYYASHPANVVRGMAHGDTGSPYDLNLIDQYRMQEAWNDGYSFYSVFVGSQWMIPNPNIEIPVGDIRQRYIDQLTYLVQLRTQGDLTDHRLSEFARWYRTNGEMSPARRFLAKEILLGSGKHVYWHQSDHYRLTIDAHQGGSIGDLRPYAAGFRGSTGPDSDRLHMGSYPYLIQSQHRSGSQHHYEDGARTTLIVADASGTVDLTNHPTRVERVAVDGYETTVHLAVTTVRLESGTEVGVTTSFILDAGPSIRIDREYTVHAYSGYPITVTEYFKGTYGWTEYPEDLRGVLVGLITRDGVETIPFLYDGKTRKCSAIREVSVTIPQISCHAIISPNDGEEWDGSGTVGTLFSPYYTLSTSRQIDESADRSSICLTLAQQS